MSERERWIVYPLLFFALGAALRDKMFHQVVSKEIACEKLLVNDIECRGKIDAQVLDCQGGVKCQGVVVVDRDNPSLRLVELGAAQPTGEPLREGATEYGVLHLRDSRGRTLCGVTNDKVFVKHVLCQTASVFAPQKPGGPIVHLGSAPLKDEKTQQQGVVGIIQVNGNTYTGTTQGMEVIAYQQAEDTPEEDEEATQQDEQAAEPTETPADDDEGEEFETS